MEIATAGEQGKDTAQVAAVRCTIRRFPEMGGGGEEGQINDETMG